MTHRHWHAHRDRQKHDRFLGWMYKRYMWRYEGDELRALEEYRRDVEQHLADVSEKIRRLQSRQEGAQRVDGVGLGG